MIVIRFADGTLMEVRDLSFSEAARDWFCSELSSRTGIGITFGGR